MHILLLIIKKYFLQCLNNGIDYKSLKSGCFGTESLEIIFPAMLRLNVLQYFPNVITLTLIGQKVPSLMGISALARLKNIFAVECQIKVNRYCILPYVFLIFFVRKAFL